MVLTLQEASFVAAGDVGQRQTHPRASPYCPGTGTTRAYSQCPAPEGQGPHGVWGLLGIHTVEESCSHTHFQLVGTSQGFIPFATVRSQTTVAISWGLIRGSLVQLLQVSVLVMVIKTLSLGTLLPPKAEGERVCRGRSPCLSCFLPGSASFPILSVPPTRITPHCTPLFPLVGFKP